MAPRSGCAPSARKRYPRTLDETRYGEACRNRQRIASPRAARVWQPALPLLRRCEFSIRVMKGPRVITRDRALFPSDVGSRSNPPVVSLSESAGWLRIAAPVSLHRRDVIRTSSVKKGPKVIALEQAVGFVMGTSSIHVAGEFRIPEAGLLARRRERPCKSLWRLRGTSALRLHNAPFCEVPSMDRQ